MWISILTIDSLKLTNSINWFLKGRN